MLTAVCFIIGCEREYRYGYGYDNSKKHIHKRLEARGIIKEDEKYKKTEENKLLKEMVYVSKDGKRYLTNEDEFQTIKRFYE